MPMPHPKARRRSLARATRTSCWTPRGGTPVLYVILKRLSLKLYSESEVCSIPDLNVRGKKALVICPNPACARTVQYMLPHDPTQSLIKTQLQLPPVLSTWPSSVPAFPCWPVQVLSLRVHPRRGCAASGWMGV
eukprot:710527-Prymnesium_polylepis.1